uniref:FCP1 homology domain-containing protein n=1 Tax=Alexandrium monilatum TaxID=311494 RepID=A0A7S4PVG7_9DINO
MHIQSCLTLPMVASARTHELSRVHSAPDDLRLRWGMELFVASFADKELIVRVLELLNCLHHFGALRRGEPPAARLFGWREIGGPLTTKGQFLQRLLAERGWRHEEVLFIDDQADNIRSARPVCRTFWVRSAQGLSMEDLEQLRSTGGAGLSLLEPSERLQSIPAENASGATEDGRRSSLAQLSSEGEGEAGSLTTTDMV